MSGRFTETFQKNFKSEDDITKYKQRNISRSQHKTARSALDLPSNSKYKTQSVFNSTVYSMNPLNPRLLGISEYQSSNSLQNSSYVWSFTKSDRFLGGVYSRPLTDSMYKMPESKIGRYTTPGHGERKDLRPIKGKNSPPPNSYFIKTCFDVNLEKKKGPKILDKLLGLVKFR